MTISLLHAAPDFEAYSSLSQGRVAITGDSARRERSPMIRAKEIFAPNSY